MSQLSSPRNYFMQRCYRHDNGCYKPKAAYDDCCRSFQKRILILTPRVVFVTAHIFRCLCLFANRQLPVRGHPLSYLFANRQVTREQAGQRMSTSQKQLSKRRLVSQLSKTYIETYTPCRVVNTYTLSAVCLVINFLTSGKIQKLRSHSQNFFAAPFHALVAAFRLAAPL